jgi:protein-tyrosine phosphatase
VITRVWERLYLGSLKDAAQLAAENPFGITAVLSLCSHKVPQKASGVSYTRVPIADSRPISAKEFDSVMAAIAEGVRNGKLLIHCVGGMSRSPIMTAAWLHRFWYMLSAGISHYPVPGFRLPEQCGQYRGWILDSAS